MMTETKATVPSDIGMSPPPGSIWNRAKKIAALSLAEMTKNKAAKLGVARFVPIAKSKA
jgi:hypothetical protein